eukprot:57092-Prymnesium_polylepis.1
MHVMRWSHGCDRVTVGSQLSEEHRQSRNQAIAQSRNHADAIASPWVASSARSIGNHAIKQSRNHTITQSRRCDRVTVGSQLREEHRQPRNQ